MFEDFPRKDDGLEDGVESPVDLRKITFEVFKSEIRRCLDSPYENLVEVAKSYEYKPTLEITRTQSD